jgi:hypothetical protein
MRKFVPLIVGRALTGICIAKGFDPFHGDKPLAVLIQSDPWAMAIGSDTPRVAIYENGDVIFIKKIKGQAAYHKIILNKQELEAVRSRLQPIILLKDLKPSYSLRPNFTDQPTAKIYIRNGNREIAASVYGMTCSRESLPADTKLSAGSPPTDLIKIHRWLCDLDYPRSHTWVPAYVEVMFWNYSYAPEASVQWPRNWPSLNSVRAIRHDDMYSLFLDGSLLPELRNFLSTRNTKGAVEISGRKMAASYRFVFPSEPLWRPAFRTAAQPKNAE